MSTVPGNDAWRDAGLVPVDPDGPRSLADEAADEVDATTPRSTSRGSPGPTATVAPTRPTWWSRTPSCPRTTGPTADSLLRNAGPGTVSA